MSYSAKLMRGATELYVRRKNAVGSIRRTGDNIERCGMNVFKVAVAFAFAVLSSLSILGQDREGAVWPTNTWRESPPEEQGLSSDLNQKADDYIRGKVPTTSSVLVTRHGFIVLEKYYDGEADSLRELYSVTKSVVSTLVGVALYDKDIENVDQMVYVIAPRLFSEDSAKGTRGITVRHLLTQTTGTEPSMSDGIGIADISFLFQLPLVYKPGSKFVYSNVNYNILSMIITERTGLLSSEYAREHLFTPLGISKYDWHASEGYTVGGDRLRMSARDIAKVGYLLLRKGKWESSTVLSEEWVDQATQKQVMTDSRYGRNQMGYGYGWWVFEIEGYSVFAGIGHLSQILCVIPKLDMVVVLTGGLDKTADRLDFVRDVIVPCIQKE